MGRGSDAMVGFGEFTRDVVAERAATKTATVLTASKAATSPATHAKGRRLDCWFRIAAIDTDSSSGAGR
jgi:hypothetical protein